MWLECLRLSFFINEDFRRKGSHIWRPSAMRIIGNEKGLNIGFLLGKWTLLATSAAELLAGGPQSYSSRTYLQQQQQQTRHAAAASCRSNTQHEAPTSRYAVYLVRCSAPAGISTLIFSLSYRPRPSRTINEMKKWDKALVPNSRRPSRLGIL